MIHDLLIAFTALIISLWFSIAFLCFMTDLYCQMKMPTTKRLFQSVLCCFFWPITLVVCFIRERRRINKADGIDKT